MSETYTVYHGMDGEREQPLGTVVISNDGKYGGGTWKGVEARFFKTDDLSLDDIAGGFGYHSFEKGHRVEPLGERTFPFGRPVLPSPTSTDKPCQGYVLGAYPSGLHVRWTPPSSFGLKPIAAMIVDNEPVPFWDGRHATERTEDWRRAVDWQEDWGSVKAVPRHNGPSGQWVDEHLLKPLRLTRDDVCISDCLDQSRLNPGQARRLADTYAPVASALGLTECTLQPVPGSESAIVREAREGHLERLRAELRRSGATKVVTLGNAALRVFKMLIEMPDGDGLRRLSHAGYGSTVDSTFEGRSIRWHPLVHPRNGARHPDWRGTHARWEVDE